MKSSKLVAQLNNTIIAVIPKTISPKSINQYRPISLCNNIYKIFTKILVNSLCNDKSMKDYQQNHSNVR